MPSPEYANSVRFVRPTITAPAFRSRSTTAESRAAGAAPESTVEPPRVTTPASSNRSLSESGTPASACSLSPARRRASTRSAAASAA
jgi:hypothetical protein